jgi:SAM-dependent methyltransferase
VDPNLVAMLGTLAGERALAAAHELVDGGPLAAASALRARGIEPALAAAALTQAELRRRAVRKFGAASAGMFFTRHGLEQATRGLVAQRRAARLRGAGVTTIADLGCGIGADTIAFARAGIRVYAVDTDPLAVAVAQANAAALGVSGLVSVSTMDAEEAPLAGIDAVFCDPARRTGTGRRIFDPSAYAPPWQFLLDLSGRFARTVFKLAPGIDRDLLPDAAEAQWVSVDGEVVEAAVWSAALAEVERRATVLRGDGTAAELTGTAHRYAPVGGVRRYLYDPDGAVLRAGLVAQFAATVDGGLADPTIGYVYSDRGDPTPFASRHEVLDVLRFSVKRLREALRVRRVGRVTIMKRGSAVDVERLRRDLRLCGDGETTVVLTRAAGSAVALLCRPVPDTDPT